jgi:hypothetical protein
VSRTVRVLALALVAGCTNLQPDVGPPLRAVCTGVDSDPAHDVSFSADIAPLFTEYHCPKCHTPGGETPIGFVVGGLDLTSYDTLRAGGVRSGLNVIVDGKPCDSVILQKLGEGPPFGSRMPLNGPPYLEAEDLQLISDWIVEGAHDN